MHVFFFIFHKRSMASWIWSWRFKSWHDRFPINISKLICFGKKKKHIWNVIIVKVINWNIIHDHEPRKRKSQILVLGLLASKTTELGRVPNLGHVGVSGQFQTGEINKIHIGLWNLVLISIIWAIHSRYKNHIWQTSARIMSLPKAIYHRIYHSCQKKKN